MGRILKRRVEMVGGSRHQNQTYFSPAKNKLVCFNVLGAEADFWVVLGKKKIQGAGSCPSPPQELGSIRERSSSPSGTATVGMCDPVLTHSLLNNGGEQCKINKKRTCLHTHMHISLYMICK